MCGFNGRYAVACGHLVAVCLDFLEFIWIFLAFYSNFSHFIHQKTAKNVFWLQKKIENWWKNLFFQKRSQVGWNYQKNRKNGNRIIFDHCRVIFRSIFGGSKSPISNLKTSFVKNAKKTYFGPEIFSKNYQKNRFFRKVHKWAENARKVKKSHISWFLAELEHFFGHFLKQPKRPISLVPRAKMPYFSHF